MAKIDSQEEGVVSRYHVAEIIEARLEEIFSLVQKELKEIGKAGLLPSGAILVGGGAKMAHVADLAKEILGLPVQIGFPSGFGGVLDKVDDPSFATAAGLILWTEEREKTVGSGMLGSGMLDLFSKSTVDTAGKLKGWMKKFLP